MPIHATRSPRSHTTWHACLGTQEPKLDLQILASLRPERVARAESWGARVFGQQQPSQRFAWKTERPIVASVVAGFHFEPQRNPRTNDFGALGVFHKSGAMPLPQEWFGGVSGVATGIKQESSKGVFYKKVEQECSTRVSQGSVTHE
jgi:hypothetical protein